MITYTYIYIYNHIYIYIYMYMIVYDEIWGLTGISPVMMGIYC